MAKKTGQSLSQGGLGELKKRLFFVFVALMVYRLGAYIPVPGLDPSRLTALFHQHASGLLGIFNMFSGGALSRMTIFAMGIMPYISASIIIQMYSQISPRLQQLRKEGEAGKHKINTYTRYTTVLLSLSQSLFMVKWLVSSQAVPSPSIQFYFTAVVTLVTGTMFLMWLGEQITERGIGNGISLIIFAGIASRFPSAIYSLFMQVNQGQMQVITLFLVIAVVVAVTVVVVYVERAQRKIRIEYASRQRGRKMYAGRSSHLPLKINMAGVIPVIFAQSIILFPGVIAKFLSTTKGFFWLNTVALSLSPGNPAYILLFTLAVIFFSFFYTALTSNPKETAENLQRSGAFIPGVRPGQQTAQYIDKVMSRLTVTGSVYLALVALLPQLLISKFHVPFYFGGTSLLIIVVVVMDFMTQVQAHFMSHKFESLMSKGGFKGL